MNNLIYQVAVGPQSKLYQFCMNSVAAYARKIGADYIVQTEPILKIKPDLSCTNRSIPSYERLGYLPIYEKENAFSYLTKYKKIAIIDADIFIKDTAPNIFDSFVEEFGGVVERDMPINQKYRDKIRSYSKGQYGNLTDVDWEWNDESGGKFMNMGLMLMNQSILKYLKGQTPKEFISRGEFKRFVDGLGNWKWSTDQTLLNYWIRKERINIQEMSWKWNALYTAVLPEKLKDAYFIHFFLKDHLPGKGEDLSLLAEAIK